MEGNRRKYLTANFMTRHAKETFKTSPIQTLLRSITYYYLSLRVAQFCPSIVKEHAWERSLLFHREAKVSLNTKGANNWMVDRVRDIKREGGKQTYQSFQPKKNYKTILIHFQKS
jgi:hypothetical protein